MKERIPTWYEWYWQNHPVMPTEQSTAKAHMIEVILQKVTVLQLLAQWDRALALVDGALSHALTQCADLVLVCRLKNEKSNLLVRTGAYETALQTTQEVVDQLTDRVDKSARYACASAINRMGSVYECQGNYDEALKCYEKSAQISKSINDLQNYGRVLNNMGNVHRFKSDYKNALHYHELAAQTGNASSDLSGYGIAVGNIGIVHAYQGEYALALRYFEEQKDICEKTGDHANYSRIVGNLGMLHYEMGQFTPALAYFEERKRFCELSNDPLGYGIVVGNIGYIYLDRGDYDRALHCFEIYKQSSEAIGNRDGYSTAITDIGKVYAGQGNYDQALTYYEEAKQISLDTGDRYRYAYIVHEIGHIHQDKGHFDLARDCYEESKQIFLANDNRRNYSQVIGSIARLYFDQGLWPDALGYINKAIDIQRELSAQSDVGHNLIFKARILLSLRDDAAAKACLEESVSFTEILSAQDIFLRQCLQAKVVSYERGHQAGVALLTEMLMKTSREAEQAALHYELWQMLSSLQTSQVLKTCEVSVSDPEEHRRAALELYQELYEKTPKFEYKKRIEELSK